ncbi:MAG: TolC family protein, partial [Novosphingobium sp.]
LRDRSATGIYAEDLALLERGFADNAARFAKREITSSDLQQVQTRVEQARAQLHLAHRTAANAEATFLAAIGAPAGDLASPNPLAMPVSSLEEAYAHAETNNPVIVAAYARERISRAGMNAARSDMLPRIDMRGIAEYGAVSPYNDDLRKTALRGEVTVSGTLFGSGLKRARMQEAEAANDADWRLLDQALRDNRSEVAAAWNEWLAQTATIEPLRRASDAARLAYEGALLQEKAGFRTTLDVLNLERELLIARTSYNAATANAFVAQARLLAAIGALEQRWLFPDAPAYDPDEHFNRTKFDGMVPIIAPLVRRLDGVFSGQRHDRPIRDPSGPLVPRGVDLPVPPAEPEMPVAEPAGSAPAP